MSNAPLRYVGIDFSGDQAQWNPNVQTSNVWIAIIEEQGGDRTLISLQSVQQMFKQGRPFACLTAWLGQGMFSAAAIDAPFSLPWWFFGQTFSDPCALWAAVDGLPLAAPRDFPRGGEFFELVAAGIPFTFKKPLRVTDSYWRGRGVNTRSAVWNRARPGTPFTSACIKLLANAGRPVWPWSSAKNVPLIEAFPAAQLHHWNLPCTQYNGLAGQDHRAAIVTNLIGRGLQVSSAFQAMMRANADALDAVLACYASRAVLQDQLAVSLPPYDAWRLEGWIAVHA